jgi:endonuclease YncB( thermonuclease family)/F0F1-type ATP synthase assembly protein I
MVGFIKVNKLLRNVILNNKILNIVAFKIYPLLGAKIIDDNCIDAANDLWSKSDASFYKAGITKETIEKLHVKEAERKKTIEDKAKTNVTAVTIAIALVTTVLTVINGVNTYSFFNTQPLSVYLLGIVMLGFIYLVISGFSAFRALQLGNVYDIYLNDEFELLGEPEETRIGRMTKNLNLNYVSTPRREAYVTASYQGMKNGIVALLVFVICGMGIFLYGDTRVEPVIKKVNPIQIQVLDVIDANTLKIKADQIEETVRLAYINSPSYSRGESYGRVAFEAVKEIVGNQQLEMEIVNYQAGNKEVFIYIDGNFTLNEYLIENGLAKCDALTKEKNVVKMFLEKQAVAKKRRHGMWS